MKPYYQPCGVVILLVRIAPHTPRIKGQILAPIIRVDLFIYFETVLFICRCPCRFIVDHCLMRFANNLIHGSTRLKFIEISPYNFFLSLKWDINYYDTEYQILFYHIFCAWVPTRTFNTRWELCYSIYP